MLSKQAVSQTVDVLVREGLVTRTEDPSDRRHMIVAPTEAGTGRLDAFEEEFVQYLAGALGGMPSAARQSAVEALRGLNALLVQRRDEGYFKQPQRTAERIHE
jgi:DNA-binding MarR family transcriptional regulator